MPVLSASPRLRVILLLFLTGCHSATADPPPNSQLPTPNSLPAAPGKPGHDWPTFLGPKQDSRSAETGIHTDWPETGPKLVWHKQLGTSYGAPTIAAGRLFQFDRFGNNSRLYCLDPKTGEEIWRHEFPTDYQDLYQYNNGPRRSPIIDGDRVYAYSVDGVLACCQAADGKPLWRKNLSKDFGVVQNFFGVGSNPVIDGDLVIVMVGGSPPDSHKIPPGQLDRVEPNGSGIVALDKLTGEVKYKIADELASYSSLKLATINDRRWCFAFCRGGLLAFEPSTGKIDFHYPWRDSQLESVNASLPVVVGDEVLISECYGIGASLLKVSPGKYDILWKDDARKRAKSLQTHWMTPIYDPRPLVEGGRRPGEGGSATGHVYASSGRHPENATLRCLEWSTGKVLWDQPGMGRTSLLAVDGHFLCLGEFGQLWLLKLTPEKPHVLASIDYTDPLLAKKLTGKATPLLEYPAWAAPVISHGLLYLRGKDRLLCLELIPPT